MIGIWQLVLIFAIILVLFGAGRIPKIMKDLGSGLRAFKNGLDSDTEEVDVEKIVGKKIKKSEKNKKGNIQKTKLKSKKTKIKRKKQ